MPLTHRQLVMHWMQLPAPANGSIYLRNAAKASCSQQIPEPRMDISRCQREYNYLLLHSTP